MKVSKISVELGRSLYLELYLSVTAQEEGGAGGPLAWY